MTVYMSSVLGRCYLSWKSPTPFFVHQNKSVLGNLPLCISLPQLMSFLALCQCLLFILNYLWETLPWQILLLCCSIYRLILSKLLALPFLCLSCWYFEMFAYLPNLPFLSHDHSSSVFFHGLSGFPTRISHDKFPLEAFWIPLRYWVYLWSVWCCNVHMKPSYVLQNSLAVANTFSSLDSALHLCGDQNSTTAEESRPVNHSNFYSSSHYKLLNWL